MTYIVAEIGMNHDGSMEKAKELIAAAAESGVNAVKFQTHIAEAETLKDAPAPPYFQTETRFEYFSRTFFSFAQHAELKQYAESLKVEYFSSPFSSEAVDLLEKVGVERYKIASGEVTNIPLLKYIAQTEKKVLLSSGMSSWTELDTAVETLRSNGTKDLIILQCSSEYPCPAEHAGLNVIGELKARYGLPVGFSDHTFGSTIAIAAVALGAVVLEKHFTLRKDMYGPDAQNSATPDEMSALVSNIREVEQALRNPVDKDQKAQALHDMKRIFEKSIVARADIPENTILTPEHLSFKKPGDGIPAGKYQHIIGQRTTTQIKKDERICYEHLKEA